jgi:hypothetical protein
LNSSTFGEFVSFHARKTSLLFGWPIVNIVILKIEIKPFFKLVCKAILCIKNFCIYVMDVSISEKEREKVTESMEFIEALMIQMLISRKQYVSGCLPTTRF